MGRSRSVRPEPVRYAVVGLGHIAQVAVLPAFAHARERARLVALVSGDARKRNELGRRYRIPTELSVDYDGYDALLYGGAVDAVYLALPNHLHCEYAVRAAKAGIHVLCEKPMAVTEDECSDMMRAAEANHVKLMIAYRLHFDPATLHTLEAVRRGEIGAPRIFDSVFTMQVRDQNIRLEREKGGGPLRDIGIYCINAARQLFGHEPMEVVGRAVAGSDPRFGEVEEAFAAILRFPDDRIASFVCSFGAADVSSYRIVGTKGDIVVQPGYEYAEALTVRTTRGGRTKSRRFRRHDQFAPELIHFAECIHEDREPEPSGFEGSRDVQVIRALHASAQRGAAVALSAREERRRPGRELEMRKPPVRKPPLVHAQSASR